MEYNLMVVFITTQSTW